MSVLLSNVVSDPRICRSEKGRHKQVALSADKASGKSVKQESANRMSFITLSLGSNQQPHRHLTQALDALAEHFGELQLSPVYESEAVGFDGDNFLNMAVALNSELPLWSIRDVLKAIEDRNGRDRTQKKFSGRTLDIDILTCDDLLGEFDGVVLPRPEITENAFVLKPLADICPSRVDPFSGESYSSLWQAYDRPQKLWPIDFTWHNRVLSRR